MCTTIGQTFTLAVKVLVALLAVPIALLEVALVDARGGADGGGAADNDDDAGDGERNNK